MPISQDDPRLGQTGTPAGDGVEKDATDASQGTKTGHIRWVLVVSLVLGVIVLGVAYVTFSASHHHPEPSPATQAAATPAPGNA